MKRIVLLVLLGLAVEVTGVRGQDVSYDFDRSADFSKFKSYKWISIKGAQQVDDITARDIIFAIDEELAKKGLLKTDSDQADLYVGYQAAISRQTPWSPYKAGWGYGPGWSAGTSTSTLGMIDAGQLDLDIYAPSEKRLVWRGTVSKTIDIKMNLSGSEKKIEKSVEKLLRNYPPKKS